VSWRELSTEKENIQEQSNPNLLFLSSPRTGLGGCSHRDRREDWGLKGLAHSHSWRFPRVHHCCCVQARFLGRETKMINPCSSRSIIVECSLSMFKPKCWHFKNKNISFSKIFGLILSYFTEKIKYIIFGN
jgi:hypothetical protein